MMMMKGKLERETKFFLLAALNNTIKTNYIKAKISNSTE